MAEVKMDLQELKALEGKVLEYKKNADTLQDIINEKNQEITKIQADKRTVRTTIKVEPESTQYIPTYSNNSENIKRHFLLKVKEICKFFCKGGLAHYQGDNPEIFTREICHLTDKFFSELEHYRSPMMSTGPTYKETKTTEYINFEDVKTEILTKLEGDVADEVTRYKKEIATLKDTLTNSGIVSDKKLKDSEEKYQNQINELIKTRDVQYYDLVKKYDDLLADKEAKSLEQQIQELKDALAAEKAKKMV